MPEEKKKLKKALKNKEYCEGDKELSLKELYKVNGGVATVQDNTEDITKHNTAEVALALQGKAAEVKIVLEGGTQGARADIRVR